MRNTIRCCISCILPCGALDVIRIVHSDGRVEEIGGGSVVSAAEVLKAYPKHVLKKPSSRCPIDESSPVVPRIVVVPPGALLKRGRIYFLIPVSSSDKTPRPNKSPANTTPAATRRKRSSSSVAAGVQNSNSSSNNNDDDNEASLKMMMKSERYLSEIMREKVSMRERRRGRVGVWRPNLESISESSSTSTSTPATTTRDQ